MRIILKLTYMILTINFMSLSFLSIFNPFSVEEEINEENNKCHFTNGYSHDRDRQSKETIY